MVIDRDTNKEVVFTSQYGVCAIGSVCKCVMPELLSSAVESLIALPTKHILKLHAQSYQRSEVLLVAVVRGFQAKSRAFSWVISGGQ